MERFGLRSIFVIIATTLLLSVAIAFSAMAENSANPPKHYRPQASSSVTQASRSLAAANTTTYDVLLIEDLAPWSSTSNEDLLNANGMSFKKIAISDVTAENLSNYNKIIIAGDQITSFYNAYMANKGRFDTYVNNGGKLEWHVCGFGWNGGDSSAVVLPGGVSMNGPDYYLYNYVEMPSHALVNGVSSPFWGSYASHGYFTNFASLPGIDIITTEGEAEGNWPTLIQYPYGRGCVVASSQPLEYGYSHSQTTGTILSNMISYNCSRGTSTYSLTITRDPQNGGNVYGYNQTDFKSNPINCGKPSTCTAKFTEGTQVTLYAIPSGKFKFSYWDNGITCNPTNPLNVWMSGNKSFDAVFVPSAVCYEELNSDGLPELHWPLEGQQSDYTSYGYEMGDPWTCCSKCGQEYQLHNGIDITAGVGKTVRAAYDGNVVLTYNAGSGWGKALVIEHVDTYGGKFTTTYIHVNPTIKQGKSVSKGDPIATIATITNSGPHLHFTLRRAPYSAVAQAGALPVVDQNDCTCTYKKNGKSYTRPIWPEFFIDPLSLSYTSE